MRQLPGLATPLKFLSTGLCGGNDLNCALHGDNARKLAAEPLFAKKAALLNELRASNICFRSNPRAADVHVA